MAAIADTIMVRIHIIEMPISTIGPAGVTGTTAATAILAIGAISEIIIVTDAPKDPMIKYALGAHRRGPTFWKLCFGPNCFLAKFLPSIMFPKAHE